MTKELWMNLCFNCMGELDDQTQVRPHCGWDNCYRLNGEGRLEQRVLNKQYIVGRALGRGGFGVTYAGYDMNLRLRVAIKEYFPATMAYRHSDGVTVRPYTGNAAEYEVGLDRAFEEGRTVVRLGNILTSCGSTARSGRTARCTS